MNQKGISSIVIILIIVGVLIIGGGIWYFLIQAITPPPTVNTLSINLINALNQKNYTEIEKLLPEKINFAIEATECCGDINRNDAISKINQLMDKTNFNFSQDQAIVKQIKDYFSKYGPTTCSDGVVGIGSDKSVLTFCISQNKVDVIRTTSNYREYGITDETANWKTYTNTKYNYQLKVPSDFINKAKPAGWVDTSKDDSVTFSREDQWYVNIQFLPDAPFYNPPTGTELVSWLKKYKMPGSESIQSPNFVIGGIPAVKIYQEGRPQAYNAYRIYFVKDYHLFSIDTLAEPDQEELCNQILATLRFTK